MNKHSLANYPKGFKGTVLSPLKICLQFKDVQVKLRKNDQADGLAKMPDTILALPVKTTGTDVTISAMGCPLPVIEELQMSLIESYRAYYKYHGVRYKEEFGMDFANFLILINSELGMLLNEILRGELVPDGEEESPDQLQQLTPTPTVH